MLIVDSMHAILEGLIHYHCRRVLQLDTKFMRSQKNPDIHPAFIHPWRPFDPKYNLHLEKKRHEISDRDLEDDQIAKIQETLQLPFESGEPRSMTKEKLHNKLNQYQLAPLQYVWFSLSLPTLLTIFGKDGEARVVKAQEKSHFIQLLIKWRNTKP
ncbi:hypothetical protein GYMLUDRAFT_247574 [Collybiopsis luxurians FD-317 M1]|uniref:Uncharacterized protein n=1 Tax=Collybiopsis luxurians FD-317 M1 TaxID=944289 RepID=A0A0D0B135_9AGAR|nr:hypothetical protein GYMLUDRAFT_247574 [Collybiopsis luxurians FD-317 M1]